ncbi:MAG: hypothetical protein IT355_20500 [Gemmatimonadaceae bacterium]|nr:hypothetical protein [Gemmatimonadaceae bacterium]
MNRTAIAVVLVLFGLAGLFMAACGGLFTVGGLLSMKGDPYATSMLVISVPSLLVGSALLWFVRRHWLRWRAEGGMRPPSPPMPPG